MRILHCCFAGGYAEGYGYQENMLTEQHRAAGHDVMVAASCEGFSNGELCTLPQGETVTASGIRICRLAQGGAVPAAAAERLRIFPEFKKLLEGYAPDIIFFHSIASRELLTAAAYKRKHPGVVLCADSHASLSNSAQNFISMNVLHKGYYRSILRRTEKYLDKLFYIGMEERDYLVNILGAERSRLELLPLGGLALDSRRRQCAAERIRKQLDIPDGVLLLCNSGKYAGNFAELKRLDVLLGAMRLISAENVRLIIIGKAENQYLSDIENAVKTDSRISFLGWKSSDELREYLCAADLYLQPGSVSSTMQTALCCGTPVVSRGHYTYKEQFDNGSGVLFADTAEEYADIVDTFAGNMDGLAELRAAAADYSADKLDYGNQARYIEGLAQQSAERIKK